MCRVSFITYSSTIEVEIPHRREDNEKIVRARMSIVFLPKMSLNFANMVRKPRHFVSCCFIGFTLLYYKLLTCVG
jgi:predicted glycosyltransferase involved in capsule biosynthesis